MSCSTTAIVKFVWGIRKNHIGALLVGLTGELTILCKIWASCAQRALGRSSVKLRRDDRNTRWPSCQSSSSSPGPSRARRADPRRARPGILHVGRPETPHCSSESCWWTGASTSRDAASLWPTRPGTVHTSGPGWRRFVCLSVNPHVPLL